MDDGIATGASMKAAAQALRIQGPRRIVVAVPIAAQQSCNEFRMEVDEVICLHTPALLASSGRVVMGSVGAKAPSLCSGAVTFPAALPGMA